MSTNAPAQFSGEAQQEIANAVSRLPGGEVGALARSAGVTLGAPTIGPYSRDKNTINIVMVDMHDDPGKDEVRRLSTGVAPGPLSPGSKREIKKALRRRKE